MTRNLFPREKTRETCFRARSKLVSALANGRCHFPFRRKRCSKLTSGRGIARNLLPRRIETRFRAEKRSKLLFVSKLISGRKNDRNFFPRRIETYFCGEKYSKLFSVLGNVRFERKATLETYFRARSIGRNLLPGDISL